MKLINFLLTSHLRDGGDEDVTNHKNKHDMFIDFLFYDLTLISYPDDILRTNFV